MEALVGFLAGLVTSVPMLGPVVLLLIGDGLGGTSRGRAWLAFALAAAICEGVHVALAVFGVAPVLLARDEVRVWARVAAGLFLVAMGVIAWRARASDARVMPDSAGRAAALGAALVLPNPGFLVAWVATLAFLGERGWVGDGSASGGPDGAGGVGFVVGAVLGVMVWFVAVRGIAGRVGARFQRRTLGVRRVLAGGLVAGGVWLVGTGLAAR